MRNPEEARREAAARRHLARLGLVLRKSRSRHWSLNDQLGYMVLDPWTNGVVVGANLELSLDDVEEWIRDRE